MKLEEKMSLLKYKLKLSIFKMNILVMVDRRLNYHLDEVLVVDGSLLVESKNGRKNADLSMRKVLYHYLINRC